MSTPTDRPRGKSLASLRSLYPFLAPYRWRLAAALVALLVAAAAMLALPVALRQLIDRGLTANSATTINVYFIGFLAAAVVFGVFAALRFYLVSSLGERVVADIRTLGLIAGIELKSLDGKVGVRAFDAYLKCFAAGLLVRTTGDVIALSPPLIIEKAQIDTLFSMLRDVLGTVA